MNPVEDFLLHKEAMSPEIRSAIQLGAIAAGTTALAAVGTAQLQAGIQAAQDAVSKSIAFKKMMVDNPNLNKMDGKRARRYFDTLYRTAPELAKDPFAAGSWVQKVNEYDYVDPQSLNTLAQTGAKLRERQTQQLMPAFQLAQGAVQTGVGEYGRLQNQAFQQAKFDREQAQKQREHAYKVKKDIVGGLFDLGKGALREHGDAMQRREDQAFKLRQELRNAQLKRWELEDSPKARGVKTMDDWNTYNQQRRRKIVGPQGLSLHPDSPRPFPGSADDSYTSHMQTTVGKTNLERLRDVIGAMKSRFGG